MLRILEEILKSYDDLISECLSQTKIYPSKARKGLGRHISRGNSEGRFCRGRKMRKRGYRKEPRRISTVFGMLDLRIRVAECFKYGARYFPLKGVSTSEPLKTTNQLNGLIFLSPMLLIGKTIKKAHKFNKLARI